MLVVVLTLALLVAASAATVTGRIDQLTQALGEASTASEELFDSVVSDPEAASRSLDAVESALSEARGEMTAFPMPALAYVPGVRKNVDAGTKALDVADSLVEDVAPTIIDAAHIIDFSTGMPRDPGDTSGGWGQSAESAANIVRSGADALDDLCAAADEIEAIDTEPLMEQVADSISRFGEAVRGACEEASEYETALDALDIGGQLVDQLGEWGRELSEGLDELGGRLDDLPGLGDLPVLPDTDDLPDLPGLGGAIRSSLPDG